MNSGRTPDGIRSNGPPLWHKTAPRDFSWQQKWAATFSEACLLTDEGPSLQTMPLRISSGELPRLQAWALKMLLLSQGAAALSHSQEDKGLFLGLPTWNSERAHCGQTQSYGLSSWPLSLPVPSSSLE